MKEALELLALLTAYSVAIVHALAGLAAMLPGGFPADVGVRDGM